MRLRSALKMCATYRADDIVKACVLQKSILPKKSDGVTINHRKTTAVASGTYTTIQEKAPTVLSREGLS